MLHSSHPARALWCVFTTRTGFLCFFCQCECIVWCADNLDSAVCTTTLITEARLDRCRLLLLNYLSSLFLYGLLPVDCLFCFSTYRWIKRRITHHLRSRTITMSFLSSIFFLIVSFRYVWLRARVCQECGMLVFRRIGNNFHQSHFVLLPIFDRFHVFESHSQFTRRMLGIAAICKWHVYDVAVLPYGKQCIRVQCDGLCFGKFSKWETIKLNVEENNGTDVIQSAIACAPNAHWFWTKIFAIVWVN